jgi:GTP-binding protein
MSSKFVDFVNIRVFSGDGGNGIVAWRREKYEPLGGPAGGTGGRGGSVILEATNDLSTLLDFHYRKEFKAEPGERGGPKNKHGRAGQDLVIRVPIGTLVREVETGNVIADLTHHEQRVMVAEGGRGGRGNTDLSTARNKAPHYCEPGEQGIERELQLELKLLADVGIVGLPNAGKSTLLSVMTAARPKIADYPFSTLQPNLGVVRRPEGDGFVMADVPGLVSGASEGVGLGHQFLRHLERTRLLVHMADISDPELEENIATIARELQRYSVRLEKLPQIIALNKCDIVGAEQAEEIADVVWNNLSKLLPETQHAMAVIPISGATGFGINDLKNMLYEELDRLPKTDEVHEIVEDVRARARADDGFVIERQKKKFIVSGVRLERLISVTNMRSSESIQHLVDIMRAMGVMKGLVDAGAEAGSDIVIGEIEFKFGQEML